MPLTAKSLKGRMREEKDTHGLTTQNSMAETLVLEPMGTSLSWCYEQDIKDHKACTMDFIVEG